MSHRSPSTTGYRPSSSSSSAYGTGLAPGHNHSQSGQGIGAGRTSLSPVASMGVHGAGEVGGMNGHGLSTSPRPNPPTSRMALSALVNSPSPAPTLGLPQTATATATSHPAHHTRASPSAMSYPAAGSSAYPSYPPTYTHPADTYRRDHSSSSAYPQYPPSARDHERERSYSHEAYPGDRHRSRGYSNGAPERGRERERERERERVVIREMVPTPSLSGGEDVWSEALRDYQKQREIEAGEVAKLAEYYLYGGFEPTSASSRSTNGKGRSGASRSKADRGDEITILHEQRRPPKKPRPSRAKQNQNKRKAAAIDAEILDLLEGDEVASSSAMRSSPPLGSEAYDEDGELKPKVRSSGLSLPEILEKIKNKDPDLNEEDRKAGNEEIWRQAKAQDGGVPLNKDGTMRKKPGPAKGYKFGPRDNRRPGSNRGGDMDSDAGDMSIAGDTVNGEAEADIAALLEDGPGSVKKGGKGNGKKRQMASAPGTVTEGTPRPSEDGMGDGFDEAALSLLGDEGGSTPSGNKKKGPGKGRQSGPGKGNWSRPQKEDLAARELTRKAEALAVQNAILPSDSIDSQMGYAVDPNFEALAQHQDVLARIAAPNTDDPRGVSENEARIRLGLVEDLQKIAWATIVKDVPRVYRVFQAADAVIKQNCSRKAQSAVKNVTAPRAAKNSYKNVMKANRDAITKAKKVTKELMAFWRKNEKDELLAKKKAEKEAVERAKAEEEAREAKRQSRKLNFLLTQTELYSHFIGKKIKTKEAEGDETPDVDPSGVNEELGLDANGEPLPDLDYDDDDEENLRRHAARGAQAAIKAAKDKASAFDRGKQATEADLDMDGDELNFQNPTLAKDSVTIEQPKMLMAQLKEYQIKGLTWLGNLYEQGINGILADEMGLGKTIQSISLLAYLAEHHGIWGPFLVIAPASTVHNWQQELVRFVPRLKAVPYWGTAEDRKILRKSWYKKVVNYNEDTPFHIVVTSYDIAVIDASYLSTMRWQYMILDEAQAIKSASSLRWKSLLSFNCRNRLLLTGTPIQNSMHELWALLHFIMPSLFDSHEEFSEWFSKDIENAAGGGASGSLKPEQLRRLHMILKPFMLRRVKKHVQKELGDKIEIDVLVDLSQRQRSIYKALRQRVSISDLIAQANNITDTSGAKNLMNLVMQFRKVCNHPDLFERADVISPYMFGTFSQSGNLARQESLYCPASAHNAIEVRLPRLIWTDGGKVDLPSEESRAGSDTRILGSLMNIWRAGHIEKSVEEGGEFGFLKILGQSPAEVEKRARANPLVKLLDGSLEEQRLKDRGEYESDTTFIASRARPFARAPKVPDIRPSASLPALTDISTQVWNTSYFSRREARFAIEKTVAPEIKPIISNRSYENAIERVSSDPLLTTAMYGLAPSQRDDPAALAQLDTLIPGVGPRGLLGASPEYQAPMSSLAVPPIKRLIVDSAKLARLDALLRELKAGGHRVLLYFQMTRMMDLIEEYLIYRQYKYLRLDGSSPIGERRDMVTSWQTNPDLFVFCLSTRAGGLGINLTAADTVIFYDHDWNPSNDAQAMDRAHRVGQTKQVTVYRLIARGTIEERILQLARAKKDVQDIVVGTKSLTDVAKPSEIVSLFMDDEELAESVAKRRQAEAHGYVAPSIQPRTKSNFGDGLATAGGGGDDDEDDFFSLKKRPANEEDDGLAAATGAENAGGGGKGKGAGGTKSKKKGAGAGSAGGGTKRKQPPTDAAGGEGGANGGGGEGVKKPSKKKVKMVGPDGLPL